MGDLLRLFWMVFKADVALTFHVVMLLLVLMSVALLLWSLFGNPRKALGLEDRND